jgi:hypothetical protein
LPASPDIDLIRFFLRLRDIKDSHLASLRHTGKIAARNTSVIDQTATVYQTTSPLT